MVGKVIVSFFKRKLLYEENTTEKALQVYNQSCLTREKKNVIKTLRAKIKKIHRHESSTKNRQLA